MPNTAIQSASTFPLVLPIAGSILVAIGGWTFAYFHKRRSDARSARLDRVNQQLGLLYGPLYARLRAGEAVWKAFSASYWPAHGQSGYYTPGYDTTDEEKLRWRTWMSEVFTPMNSGTESLILDHMDLLEDADFPDAFVDVLAHIAAYRAVMKQWEIGDFSEHISVCNFPSSGLLAVVEPIYKRLRAEQKALIQGVQIKPSGRV